MIRYYKEASTDPGPSPRLWADCPWAEMILDPNAGYTLWDDFVLFLEDTGGWVSGGDNDTCTVLATEVGGVIQVGGVGAAQDEGYLTSGNNEAGFVKMYPAAPKELWFETRVRINDVTTLGTYIGLAEQAHAANNTLVDATGELSSSHFVGFHADQGAPTLLDAVYRTAGTAVVIPKAAAQTLETTTWYKFGLHYKHPYLNWYIDGVRKPLSAAITGVEVDYGLNLDDALLFPDDEELAVLIGVKDVGGTTINLDIDWVRVAQRR